MWSPSGLYANHLDTTSGKVVQIPEMASSQAPLRADKVAMNNIATNSALRLTAADSSKLLKKALRKTFTGVKFSVKMDRGTAYGCASISWTDGPSIQDVEKVTALFEGQGFDGMTDSSYRKPTAIEIDGTTYESGLRMISTSRNNSPERLARVVDQLKSQGYIERSAGGLECAAAAILRGCAVPTAVDYNNLTRS